MESHDEERMMYRNLQFGNSSGSYNTRNLNTALRRMEQAAAFLLTIPGPKMIWQFGELGYDFSINRCENGTISNDCRLSPKPIRWDYMQVVERRRLYDIYSSLNKLRYHTWYKDVFTGNNISISRNLSPLYKWMTIRSATDSSMLSVVGNFDVNLQTVTFTFPTAGTWYDYLEGTTITATGGAQSLTLQPGEYHVYLNRNLVNAVVTPVPVIPDPANELSASVFPNPAKSESVLELSNPASGKVEIELVNGVGQKLGLLYSGILSRGNHRISLHDKIDNLPAGLYIVSIYAGGKKLPIKLMVQ